MIRRTSIVFLSVLLVACGGGSNDSGSSGADESREESAVDEGDAGDAGGDDEGSGVSGDLYNEIYDFPPCSDLVDGQPVPADFIAADDVSLSCKNGDEIFFGESWECNVTFRKYVYNDFGWAFVDEKIYYEGDDRQCIPDCSELIEGQPVPDQFKVDSPPGFNISCESSEFGEVYANELPCPNSGRLFQLTAVGHAFVDEGVYYSGRPNC